MTHFNLNQNLEKILSNSKSDLYRFLPREFHSSKISILISLSISQSNAFLRRTPSLLPVNETLSSNPANWGTWREKSRRRTSSSESYVKGKGRKKKKLDSQAKRETDRQGARSRAPEAIANACRKKRRMWKRTAVAKEESHGVRKRKKECIWIAR